MAPLHFEQAHPPVQPSASPALCIGGRVKPWLLSKAIFVYFLLIFALLPPHQTANVVFAACREVCCLVWGFIYWGEILPPWADETAPRYFILNILLGIFQDIFYKRLKRDDARVVAGIFKRLSAIYLPAVYKNRRSGIYSER